MERINRRSILIRVDPTFKELVDSVNRETGKNSPEITRDFAYKIRRGINLTVRDWF